MIDTTALRKAAGTARLNVDKAREALEEFREVRDAAEEVGNTDIPNAIEGLLEAVDALDAIAGLGLMLDTDDVMLLRSALEDFQNIDVDLLEAVHEAYDDAEQAVETCEEHREAERGEFDADTKAEAREEAQIALNAFADALENAAAPASPVMAPDALKAIEAALT